MIRILSAIVAGAPVLSAWIGTHGMQWHQFHLPAGYSAYLIADVAISWALAGLAIAAILPRRA